MRRLLASCAIAVAVALMFLDPYSFGRQGGDVWAVRFEWQRFAAAAQVLVLVGAALAMWLRPPWARRLILLELCLRGALNAIYVLRDGSTRVLFGYESHLRTLWVLAAGVAIRILVLRLYSLAGPGTDRSGDASVQESRQAL